MLVALLLHRSSLLLLCSLCHDDQYTSFRTSFIHRSYCLPSGDSETDDYWSMLLFSGSGGGCRSREAAQETERGNECGEQKQNVQWK